MPMQITSEKLYLAKRKRNEAEKQNIFQEKNSIEMIGFFYKKY